LVSSIDTAIVFVVVYLGFLDSFFFSSFLGIAVGCRGWGVEVYLIGGRTAGRL
jgi:hypothetical protein